MITRKGVRIGKLVVDFMTGLVPNTPTITIVRDAMRLAFEEGEKYEEEGWQKVREEV